MKLTKKEKRNNQYQCTVCNRIKTVPLRKKPVENIWCRKCKTKTKHHIMKIWHMI